MAAANLTWAEVALPLGLSVSRGTLPADLPGALRPRRDMWVENRRALIRYPGQWALLVEDGRDVVVEWPDVEEPSWVIDRWAAPIATMQRGDLCLHAVAVALGGVAVAIAGASGAGKSTTALSLHQRGHDLLCDDVCIVEAAGGTARVRPFLTDVHLLPDAVTALGLDTDALPSLVAFPGKYAARPSQPEPTATPLGAIVHLVRSDSGEVAMTELRGGARIQSIAQVLAMGTSGVASAILGPQGLFEKLTALADSVRVYEISRPAGEWTLETVLDLIESVAQSE